MTEASSRDDLAAIQDKWMAVWAELNQFAFDRSSLPADAPVRYVLDMFAYPSGDLHMGHAEAYAMGDAVARYWTLRGERVFHPVGWDSFGLPAENAAIKRDQHPATWTYANIDTQAESFRRYAISFDWSTRLHTSDPEYYRWTQWLFLRFWENGLAYRRAAAVNWCPVDQTVLANEQVIAGACERCGNPVTKRDLTQWFFAITTYADRLLDDMALLEGSWPERVLTMQRHWIGRQRGATVAFRITGRAEPVEVFTTRPDTIFGTTFLVVAVDSPIAEMLCAGDRRAEFEAYRERTRGRSDIERLAEHGGKTGVELGRTAIHPLTGAEIPVWASDYVLATYGTGAVMGVPAHDQRDLDFARAYGLPIVALVDGPDPADTGVALPADGPFVGSGPLDGLDRVAAIDRVIDELTTIGAGAASTQYRLRDWLISRQRYWGCPIPIIHCPDCGEQPVPDEQLPVVLPDLRGEQLRPAGVSPLAAATDWVETECPKCGGPARRDTDTMDTFVDSSWYFLRYCSPDYTDGPFDPVAVRERMPVDQYVGGVEHAILHLLYTRFFTKVLHDLGMVDFVEPIRALMNQGQVILDGAAMSKSKGNMVVLGEQIAEFGVDAVRLSMMFAGPPEDDIDWADVSPHGSRRFLNRVQRLAGEVTSSPGADPATGSIAIQRASHRAIAQVTEAVEGHRFNIAIARIMELTNAVRTQLAEVPGGDAATRAAVEAIAVMLSLFAPYTAEEMWERLGHRPGIATTAWPAADPDLAKPESVTCVVQVNGKVRARIEVDPSIAESELTTAAATAAAAQLAGRSVVRTIARPPTLVNFVVT